jgi:hypothetical protein
MLSKIIPLFMSMMLLFLMGCSDGNQSTPGANQPAQTIPGESQESALLQAFDSYMALQRCTLSGKKEVFFDDVAGHGDVNGIISYTCIDGRSAWPQLAVFEQFKQKWVFVYNVSLNYSAAKLLSIKSGMISVEEPHFAENDAQCCPSGTQVKHYQLKEGGVLVEAKH